MTTRATSRGSAGKGAVDERTVGDLLLDADLTARELLWTRDAVLAKGRAIGLEKVVDAAAQLWSAIPDRGGDVVMTRVHALVRRRPHDDRGFWLSDSEDPAMTQVRDNLGRAARMVAARRHPTAALSEPGHLDSEAARTRIMHTLYVAAHATAASLDGYARTLRYEVGRHGRVPEGESISLAEELGERLTVVENLAAGYLQTRWPAALGAQHREPSESSRLASAVADWHIQAGRTLAGEPVAVNLLLVARVERELTIGNVVITAAASNLGRIDERDPARAIEPLVELEKKWATAARDLEPLADRTVRADRELMRAASEMRAAVREITHEQGGLATPATMDGRVDLGLAARDLHRSLPGSADVAHSLRESVADPALTGRAAGVQAICSRLGSELEAWVDVSDVANNRVLPLPRAARSALGERFASAGAAALAADIVRNVGTRGSSNAPAPRPGGQGHERREPMRAPVPAPGFGCDR